MSNKIPIMDCDGYPTDETIKTIEKWKIHNKQDMVDLLEYVEEAWYYPDYFTRYPGEQYAVSTGGWSGNEDLIAAMNTNYIFWMFCWVESRRGGHYKFEVPNV